MQINYHSPYIRLMGFWQENSEGEIVSYKRIAMFTVCFRGTQLRIDTRLDGDVQWYLDGEAVNPHVLEHGFQFSLEDGEHCLKAVLLSPSRMYLKGAETNGVFLSQPERPYIHFIGDSITHAYPGFASAVGDALCVDYSVVAHCGMSLVDGWGWYPLIDGLKARVGMESNYFQLETPDLCCTFTPHNFAHRVLPDVIVIYLGVNDYLTEGPTYKDENPDLFVKSYTAFVHKLREIYLDVPVVMLQCHLPDRTIRIKAIEDAYRRISREMENVYLTDTHLWGVEVCSDKVHPSPEGYTQIAQKLAEFLKSMI